MFPKDLKVALVDIDESNFVSASKLTTNPNGEMSMSEAFVMSNLFSIAQVQFLPGFHARAIMIDDVMVGFVMYGLEERDPWIYRFMIDCCFQGKGYGRASMKCIIGTMKNKYQSSKLFISIEPENIKARSLYESLGFIDTGRVEEGECVFELGTSVA